MKLSQTHTFCAVSMIMVFNFRTFLLYDVQILTMTHGMNFKSTVPSHGTYITGF